MLPTAQQLLSGSFSRWEESFSACSSLVNTISQAYQEVNRESSQFLALAYRESGKIFSEVYGVSVQVLSGAISEIKICLLHKNLLPAAISACAIAAFCHFAIVWECALCVPLCMVISVLVVITVYGETVTPEVLLAALLTSAIAVGVHGVLLALGTHPMLCTAVFTTFGLLRAEQGDPLPAPLSQGVDLAPVYPIVYFFNENPEGFRLLGGQDDGKHVLCEGRLIEVAAVRQDLQRRGEAASLQLALFQSAILEDEQRREGENNQAPSWIPLSNSGSASEETTRLPHLQSFSLISSSAASFSSSPPPMPSPSTSSVELSVGRVYFFPAWESISSSLSPEELADEKDDGTCVIFNGRLLDSKTIQKFALEKLSDQERFKAALEQDQARRDVIARERTREWEKEQARLEKFRQVELD